MSATEPCKPCTQCVGLQSMSAPCVESDDAVCRCAYGYYQDEASGSCRECRVCEVGFGLMFPCQDSQDTVCEECPEGTFSSEANFVDPCLPCTTCEENEVLVKECTATSDAECRGNAACPGHSCARRVSYTALCLSFPLQHSGGGQWRIPGLRGEEPLERGSSCPTAKGGSVPRVGGEHHPPAAPPPCHPTCCCAQPPRATGLGTPQLLLGSSIPCPSPAGEKGAFCPGRGWFRARGQPAQRPWKG